MKIIYLILILAIVFLAVWFLPLSKRVGYSKVIINEKIWDVELAQSMSERDRGLSGRNFLPKQTGLLFVFSEETDSAGIWMKEMKFPIDIIWFNKNFEVVGIKENATPESFPEIFKPRSRASFVLEINAGEAKEAQIKLKDIVEVF